jgi:hypothetical protein
MASKDAIEFFIGNGSNAPIARSDVLDIFWNESNAPLQAMMS